MTTKELKLILLDIVDVLVEIVDCSSVYSSGKADKIKRLIDKIGKIKEKENKLNSNQQHPMIIFTQEGKNIIP
jgi:hypothetical protein